MSARDNISSLTQLYVEFNKNKPIITDIVERKLELYNNKALPILPIFGDIFIESVEAILARKAVSLAKEGIDDITSDIAVSTLRAEGSRCFFNERVDRLAKLIQF